MLTKTASPAISGPGTNVTYELVVTNEGPSIITGLSVTDAVPGLMTYVSSASSAGQCVYDNGQVVCDIGILTNNTSATMQVVAADRRRRGHQYRQHGICRREPRFQREHSLGRRPVRFRGPAHHEHRVVDKSPGTAPDVAGILSEFLAATQHQSGAFQRLDGAGGVALSDQQHERVHRQRSGIGRILPAEIAVNQPAIASRILPCPGA